MVTLQSKELIVTVNSKGAELSHIKNSFGTEFIWQADESIWPRHAPVLFPIVGRLKENYFLFESKKYELPQHGFARDREFELVLAEKDSCVFRLSSDAESKKKYPFDFILEITYTLKGTSLEVNYSVKNNSVKELYFSIGAHPGFNCPLSPSEKFEDYYLEFEKDEITLTSLKEGLLSNEHKKIKLKDRKLFLNKALFNEDALILENNQVNKISLCSSKSDHKIAMECKDWPYFGIWTKKDCDKFICLEPWYGITDSIDTDHKIENKKGIIFLASGEAKNYSYIIIL